MCWTGQSVSLSTTGVSAILKSPSRPGSAASVAVSRPPPAIRLRPQVSLPCPADGPPAPQQRRPVSCAPFCSLAPACFHSSRAPPSRPGAAFVQRHRPAIPYPILLSPAPSPSPLSSVAFIIPSRTTQRPCAFVVKHVHCPCRLDTLLFVSPAFCPGCHLPSALFPAVPFCLPTRP